MQASDLTPEVGGTFVWLVGEEEARRLASSESLSVGVAQLREWWLTLHNSCSQACIKQQNNYKKKIHRNFILG